MSVWFLVLFIWPYGNAAGATTVGPFIDEAACHAAEAKAKVDIRGVRDSSCLESGY